MPRFISNVHGNLIDRLINEGKPRIIRLYRPSFAKDSEGNIFPIKIYINYCFKYSDNDFVFSALILKVLNKQIENSKIILLDCEGKI